MASKKKPVKRVPAKHTGLRQQRIRELVATITLHGPAEAKRILLARWKCAVPTYSDYLTDAYRILREASEINPADMKAELTAKLRKVYAEGNHASKIRAAAYLAKIHGSFAPVQVVQTNIDAALDAKLQEAMIEK